MLNKLSVQIGILVFITVIGVSGLHSWLDYERAQKQLPLSAQVEAVEVTKLIAAAISNNLLYQKPFQIWEQMRDIRKRFADSNEIMLTQFTVLDRENRVLADSNPQVHPVMTQMDAPATGVRWDGHMIRLVEPVLHPSDGRVIGLLLTDFDASFIELQKNELIREVTASVVIALLLALGLAIAMAYRVSTPLRRLATLSARIGDGDIDISDVSLKTDEIKGLASAIWHADRSIDQQKKELAHSQSLLSSVLGHSPAVIFIKDAEGKYILVNKRFESLHHISNEDIQGKTDADIFDQDLANMLRDNDLQVLESGEAMVAEEWVPDTRGLRQYYSLKFPLYDADQHIYAICGIATDVTEQNEAMQQAAKLATVIEQTDEMVMITDRDGLIEYVNPAFENVSGYAASEAVGKRPNLVKSGVHTDKYYRSMWEVLMEGKTWRGDFTNRKKNGDLYQVTQSITPILNDKGRITGFSSVQLDVTEQRKLQQRMQHTDRVESLGVLAGGIAHDFNNLLTAILGNSSLAKRRMDASSPVFRYLESIESASHSAADLCKQMLAYSGKGKFVVKAINLSNMVENMGKLIEVSLAKNVVIKYHLSEQLPLIDADVAQIQQVVLNLITNASEAIEGKSGVISISTGMMHADADYLNGCIGNASLEPGRYIYLEVSDTGCGMDAATQRKVFDPFFTTKFTGRGLGMSAMLGIVKGHRGGLRIYSERGHGTTIKIAFPVSDESNAGVLEAEEGRLVEWRGKGTVLVVDDEETVRETACAMLEEFGFAVMTAKDGLEGVEIFRQSHADITLVLLDMTMPKMNGEDCFRELRQINPEVRVILSSGYNEQDATNRFAGKGLAGFLQKPYSSDFLAEKIQAILD